jgi:uncharacterized protein YxjI
MRNKLLSIGGDSMIKDGRGHDVYFVDGAAISIGRRLTIKDLKGHELATIQQELLTIAPKFEIHIKDGIKAHVSMNILSLTDRLKIDVPGSNDLEAHGNIFHHEYDIDRRGHRVARISKALISVTDSYAIDTEDDEDQVLLLACAVVIDAILDLREKAEHD